MITRVCEWQVNEQAVVLLPQQHDEEKPEGGTMMAVAGLQNRRQHRILTLLLHASET